MGRKKIQILFLLLFLSRFSFAVPCAPFFNGAQICFEFWENGFKEDRIVYYPNKGDDKGKRILIKGQVEFVPLEGLPLLEVPEDVYVPRKNAIQIFASYSFKKYFTHYHLGRYFNRLTPKNKITGVSSWEVVANGIRFRIGSDGTFQQESAALSKAEHMVLLPNVLKRNTSAKKRNPIRHTTPPSGERDTAAGTRQAAHRLRIQLQKMIPGNAKETAPSETSGKDRLLAYHFTYQGKELSAYVVIPQHHSTLFDAYRERELRNLLEKLDAVPEVSDSNEMAAKSLLGNTEKWAVDFYDGKGLFGEGRTQMREGLLEKESILKGRSGMIAITPRHDPDHPLATLRIDTLVDRESPIEHESHYPFELRMGEAKVKRTAITIKDAPLSNIRLTSLGEPGMQGLNSDEVNLKFDKTPVATHEYRGWDYSGAGAEIKSVINNSADVDVFGLTFLFAEAHGLTRYSREQVRQGDSGDTQSLAIEDYWMECDVKISDWESGNNKTIVDYYKDNWGFKVYKGKGHEKPKQSVIPGNYTLVLHANRKSIQTKMKAFFTNRVANDGSLKLTSQIPVDKKSPCKIREIAAALLGKRK